MMLEKIQHLDDVEKPQRPELNFRYKLRKRRTRLYDVSVTIWNWSSNT